MHAVPQQQWAFAAVLAGAVCIGFAPLFVRWSEVGPTSTAFYRLLFALPFLGLWAYRTPPAAVPTDSARVDRKGLMTAGLLFAGDLSLWHSSIQLTSVANATLLANLAPLVVTLGARIWLQEPIRPGFLRALAIALAGSVLLTLESLQTGTGLILGDLTAVAAAVFYGGYMIMLKDLRTRCSTAQMMFGSGLAATPALLLVALAAAEPLLPRTPSGWATLAGLALVSQVAGQSLIAYGFAHLPASFSALSLLLQPVVAALLAWWILLEPLTLLKTLGGVTVLLGIAMARRASLSLTPEVPLSASPTQPPAPDAALPASRSSAKWSDPPP